MGWAQAKPSNPNPAWANHAAAISLCQATKARPAFF